MNSDLQRERERATFSVEKLTHLLDGSQQKTLRRRQLEAIIVNDPTGIFSNDNNAFMHRTDRHIQSLAKHVRLIEICRSLGIGNNENGEILQSPDFPILLSAIADDLPTSLHWVMFVPNIISLCDEQQQTEWLPMCRDWLMIGCYAQTELGHGSNVRALETTATFLPESKGGGKGGSWIIHSPTLTSSKFWPGTLGRTANHAMVIANLIDGNGINRGVHNFLVPLRSMKDHKLLPGVTTGDIGPKIGYNVMDNGYAHFDHVVIPRRNMAMRFATVDEYGKYKTKHVSDAASKIAYITMMQVRAHICVEAGKNLAMACTIVTRYSVVRRQGFVSTSNNGDDSSTKNEEMQILDYKQQQHRILPLIAATYCFFFTGKTIQSRLTEIERRLVSSSSSSLHNGSNKILVTKTEVADIHASTSGLKSYMTTVAANGIEDCRKACGGHGFLQCSGLPELLTTYLQSPTVEGDNHMLPQQVVKVLLKIVHAVQKQQKQQNSQHDFLSDFTPCDSYHLVPSLQYIIHGGGGKNNKCQACCEKDMQELDTLCCAFRHVAARLLVECANSMQTTIMKNDKSSEEAWNDSLIQMARVSRAYSQFLLLINFCHGIDQVECNNNNGAKSSPCIGVAEVAVLRDLARLLALYWMESDIGDFLQDGYISAKQANWVRSSVLHLLNVVRPNAVALVDARDFSDFRLKSALGRYDGNVYPAIMEAARRDPLNQTEPGPGYEEHLKRLIVGGVGVYTGTASRL